MEFKFFLHVLGLILGDEAGIGYRNKDAEENIFGTRRRVVTTVMGKLNT
jgi:hypothetical protein